MIRSRQLKFRELSFSDEYSVGSIELDPKNKSFIYHIRDLDYSGESLWNQQYRVNSDLSVDTRLIDFETTSMFKGTRQNVKSGVVLENEMRKRVSEGKHSAKYDVEESIMELKKETAWHALNNFELQAFIFFHLSEMSDRQFERWAQAELKRLQDGCEGFLDGLKHAGIPLVVEHNGMIVPSTNLSADQELNLDCLIANIQTAHSICYSEFYSRIYLEEACRAWIDFAKIRIRTLNRANILKAKIEQTGLELSDISIEPQIFEKCVSDLSDSEAETIAGEYLDFLTSLSEALNQRVSFNHRNWGPQAERFDKISIEYLNDCFNCYWRNPQWKCNYFDGLFIVSFLRREFQSFANETLPRSALGALFISNRKRKATLFETLCKLVVLAESSPCSIKFLREKIVEATTIGCFVHPAVVALVDRAMADGDQFLKSA